MKKNRISRWMVHFGVLGVMALLWQTNVWGVGTNKSVLEYWIKPGTWISASFNVYTSNPYVKIRLLDWSIGLNGESQIKSDLPPESEWIKMPTGLISRGSSTNEYVVVTYSIQLPAGDPRERTAQIEISEVGDSQEGMSISAGVLMPIYVAPEAPPAREVAISKVEYNKGKLQIKLNNDNIVHIRPNIGVVILGGNSQSQVAVEPKFSIRSPIFPKSARIFSKLVPIGIPGNYIAKVTINWGADYGQPQMAIRQVPFTVLPEDTVSVPSENISTTANASTVAPPLTDQMAAPTTENAQGKSAPKARAKRGR